MTFLEKPNSEKFSENDKFLAKSTNKSDVPKNPPSWVRCWTSDKGLNILILFLTTSEN